MPRKPLTAVIVGTGGIARSHVRALQALTDRVEVVAAVDVDVDRAAAFAAEWGIPRVAGDLASHLPAACWEEETVE